MLSKDQIELIVQQTLAQMTSGAAAAPAAPAPAAAAPAAAPVAAPAAEVKGDGGWMFDSAEVCIEKAAAAQKQLVAMGMAKRFEIIEAMRKAAHANADMLGRMAREETGYGRVEHKIAKVHLAADKTPGPEDVVAEVYTGDRGMTLVEQAPFGVIGSITPSTNPPSTVVNNSISMISAGNAVVFNPHPAALKVSQAAMRVMHEAIVSVGGPAGLVCCPTNPNMETSAVIMSHPKVKLLSVTGGEGVVKVAMKSGKKSDLCRPR
jgi:propionaldehyde dehydrogenase